MGISLFRSSAADNITRFCIKATADQVVGGPGEAGGYLEGTFELDTESNVISYYFYFPLTMSQITSIVIMGPRAAAEAKARQALLRGVRHHYDIVRDEKPSFYTFAYATINPAHADLEGAIEDGEFLQQHARGLAHGHGAADLRELPADARRDLGEDQVALLDDASPGWRDAGVVAR